MHTNSWVGLVCEAYAQIYNTRRKQLRFCVQCVQGVGGRIIQYVKS